MSISLSLALFSKYSSILGDESSPITFLTLFAMGIVTVINGIRTAYETAEERIERLKKEAEDRAAEAEKNAFKALARTKLVKVTGGKKKVTVKWEAVEGAGGYRIIVAKNKKAKIYKANGAKQARTYNVKGANKVRKIIKKLKKGKYYVRVRAFKTCNGNTVYGKLSKVKSVKVK